MKRYLMSVDPGVWLCGWALWDATTGELRDAGLARTPDGFSKEQALKYLCAQLIVNDARLIIEKPQVYARSKSKGDPNDLIDVAVVVGGLVSQWPAVDTAVYLPRAWKGTVKKEVMVRRIRDKWVTAEECKRVQLPKEKELRHNVWDAVGLGAFHLRKLKLRPRALEV